MHVTEIQGFLVKVLGQNYVLFPAVFKMQCNTHILQAQKNLVPLLSMSTVLSRVLSMKTDVHRVVDQLLNFKELASDCIIMS